MGCSFLCFTLIKLTALRLCVDLTQFFLTPLGYASESAPLPEEIRAAHESPPITDTEDSPPPLRRNPPVQNGGDGGKSRIDTNLTQLKIR